MKTKLTLSIERRVALKARRYARKHNTSLSKLVENYLKVVIADDLEIENIDPQVLEIADPVPPENVPDLKEMRFLRLRDKYFR